MLLAVGLCSITTLWASSNSGSPQRVTINLKDAEIKQVFAEIVNKRLTISCIVMIRWIK